MSPGDLLLATFAGDTAFPAITHPGEIRFVDLVGRTVDVALQGGGTLTADYSPGGDRTLDRDEGGGSVTLERHDIYVPQAADPAVSDVALLSFADGSQALCFVESIDETVNVQLYEAPFPRLSLSAGRGWHKVTDFQYAQLALLLDGLEDALAAMPEGCIAQSIEQPPAYGRFATGRLVGQVSLTAARRADPWPPTCDWMRARLAGT
jgi:hypothetical protein